MPSLGLARDSKVGRGLVRIILPVIQDCACLLEDAELGKAWLHGALAVLACVNGVLDERLQPKVVGICAHYHRKGGTLGRVVCATALVDEGCPLSWQGVVPMSSRCCGCPRHVLRHINMALSTLEPVHLGILVT